MASPIRRITIPGGGSRKGDSPAAGGARITRINTHNGTQNLKHATFNWRQELVDGDTDGLTSRYTLQAKPIYPMIVTVYLNGVLQRQGIDYNVVGQDIVFTEIIPAGYNIVVKYNAIAMER